MSDIEAMREEHAAHGPEPRRHARPADHRGRDLRRRREAALLQPGVPEAVGPRHGFLDSAPDNALLLDRLRSDGKIAEQPEWRRWKENLLAAYRAVESQEHWWHLPDGRTIRVVANPQPKGGVTWVFENLTEKIDLESRYNDGGARPGRDARQSCRRRRGVRPRRPHPPVQPGLHRAVGSRRRSSPSPARTSRRSARPATASCSKIARGRGFVAAVTGFDDERRDRHGQTELEQRHCAALRRHPSAQRPGDDDLRRRHRQRQRRAGAEGEERGAAESRPAEERFRPARLLRTALAADQHHRLHRTPVAARLPAR